MKIRYCSDLHLEFADNKEYIRNNPIEPIADILILAGDIVPFKIMDEHKDFFDYISRNFETTFWIPGNHEYYYYKVDSSSFLDTKIRENVFLVNNCVKEVSGVNLIFSTLWSNISKAKHWTIQQAISDFKVIKCNNRLFNVDDYNLLHKESISFIQKALAVKSDNKNIVVTHHTPTFVNYPEKYINSKINEAFATNLTDFIEENDIDYWIYGHHHSNVNDFQIGNTKLVTNQLGYVKYNENVDFNSKAFIKI
ncbi:metallophosphoesterase [Flavobacterium aquatile]|uniref:Metallophosphoesterase n=1 Tax=Flavobacterium aquatile LMG 4008 = ATCC 11947 TaxID=1453498 RepID=A0A095TX58_9FLAO|nr:metallophosphoesterase [Flavobacterium aquatile]KGD66963.1 metallophosphoesterase [Flavobacterium aquatile LMG 4008 = ATCC 11947]OXA68058.1 metallophosphoesterase [Flavobacterium aquatile] [Flavobacterium aquatile LMG 4008 = ATCC 11947]